MSERPHTVLLTGATGFIGSHLARRLLEDGHRVRCLVRAATDSTALALRGAEPVAGDLTDPQTLSAAARGSTHVIHCGALVSDWASVAEIERVNVHGTRSLLEAAIAAGSLQRFIQISSTDIYGHPGGTVDESHTAARFSNWYAQTKLMAEREAQRLAAAAGIELVVLRPATVYGPGSTAVVGEIAAALSNGSMLLIGGGRALAGLLYVENLADLVALCLHHDRAPGQAFNATDGLPVTWRQFTDDIARGLGASPARWSMPYPLASGLGFSMEHGYRALRRATRLRTRPLLSRQAVQVMGRDQSFANSKARELLGWEPRVGYEDGMRATLRWLRSLD